MRIAFHSNQLSLGGTEVALYDYAHCNETILGNESVILTPEMAPWHHEAVVARFAGRFRIYVYRGRDALDAIIGDMGIDVFYAIKEGLDDGLVSKRCRSVVHAVFRHHQPHGDVYAYVSRWLAHVMSGGALPFVPHMIRVRQVEGNLRQELGIPPDAFVFGRYGHTETFDIPFVHRAVRQCALENRNRYFLFMNTLPFCEELPNIKHLPGTIDPVRKAQFIATCDAMLHARWRGETFGIAIGEFSSMNKPVLTWERSPERSHLEILGHRAVRYREEAGLLALLMDFRPDPSKNYDAYTRDYSPAPVMARFHDVFLTKS